jgi:hypothetical protein
MIEARRGPTAVAPEARIVYLGKENRVRDVEV